MEDVELNESSLCVFDYIILTDEQPKARPHLNPTCVSSVSSIPPISNPSMGGGGGAGTNGCLELCQTSLLFILNKM